MQHQHRDARPRPQWPLLLFIGLCAGGAGATGALMWAQNRAPQSSSQSSAPYEPIAPSDSVLGAAPSTSGASDEPVTAGMAPAQAALTLGNWHYDNERWPTAVESYRQAIAGGLDNPNVRTDMGNALRFAGEPKKALEQYLIAQRQDASHQQSLFNQGGLWAFSMNDKARGIQAWRKYLKRFPQGQSVQAARELLEQVGAKP